MKNLMAVVIVACKRWCFQKNTFRCVYKKCEAFIYLYNTIIFVDGQTSASSLISLFPQQSTAAALLATVTGLNAQYLPGKNSNVFINSTYRKTVAGFERVNSTGPP
jgi:hypothetical protein